MKPDRFVELWETKYEKLSPAHTDLMIERLLGFNIRSIDEEWIVKAIDVDGLKLLIDIVYQALEYQDEALKASSRRMVPQPDSKVVIQGIPRSSARSQSKFSIGELWALCNDASPMKRARVAENVQAIPSMLAQLARDPKQLVREAVGSNSQASVEILSMLANDAESRVRFRVASNPRTPLNVLARLANDVDPEVSTAAQAQQKKPRKHIATDAFYSIGMTIDEGIHPDVIILDANVVLLLEEWARSSSDTGGFGDMNESVRPLLKVLRETKFATFEQGALEAAWPSPKRDTKETTKLVAFNRARMTDLVNLLTFLRKGSDDEVESWLDSNRKEGVLWGSGVPNDFDFERAKSRILEAWMLACLLIEHVTGMEINEGAVNIKEIQLGVRIRSYKNYLDSVSGLGMNLDGEMLFLARMGFFGGRIRFGSRVFAFADITKKSEWSRRGTLAIGRNIAMDVALMRVARDLRLSSGSQSKLRTSIITGDLGLLAIFQYIVKEWREDATGENLVKYEWPPESDIYEDPRAFHAFELVEDPKRNQQRKANGSDWLIQELLGFAD